MSKSSFGALCEMALIALATSALAPSIDHSHVQILLQGIADAIIGHLGTVIGARVLIGMFLSYHLTIVRALVGDARDRLTETLSRLNGQT